MQTIHLVVEFLGLLAVILIPIYCYREWKSHKKFIKHHEHFLYRKKKEWNDFVEGLIEENKNNKEGLNYVNTHFKKFEL